MFLLLFFLPSLCAIYPCTFMQLHESWELNGLKKKKKSKAFSWLFWGVFVCLCSVWCMRPSPHFYCFSGEVKIKRETYFLLLGHFPAGAGAASVCSGLCGDLRLAGLLLAWNTWIEVASTKKSLFSYLHFICVGVCVLALSLLSAWQSLQL